MALVKTVILVDGENLVMRYKKMLSDTELTPKKSNEYIEDVFVWNNEFAEKLFLDIFRIKYFTSAVGSHDDIFDLRKRISQVKYEKLGNYYEGCQINPYIYKKERKSQKVKLIDINVAVEAMRMAYSDSVDAICIVSGDGDFVELYQDIMKRGKQVCVAALSSGLHPKIPVNADRFFCLDEYFFDKVEKK